MMESEKNLAHATSSEAPEELLVVKELWKKYGDHAASIVLVVLLAVVGYRFVERRQGTKDVRASIAYSHAESTADLENIIATYKKSPVAVLARLRLGAEHYQDRQYDLAIGAYDEFLTQHPKHPLGDYALLGKAHSIEARGDFAKAEAIFADFEATRSSHYLAPLSTLGRARCLAFQGKKDQALLLLDRMLADRAGTHWAGRADDLKVALPRLEFDTPGDLMDLLNSLDLENPFATGTITLPAPVEDTSNP